MRQGRLSSYLLPSLVDVLFISLVLALAYGTPNLHLLNDPGIGWHIRTGEWILNHHAVPYRDLYSFSKPDAPWYAWEWGSDIIFGSLHRAAGLKLIPTMAKECRKYGISLVLASQEAKDFNVSLFSAIANYLVLRLTEADAKALVRNVAAPRGPNAVWLPAPPNAPAQPQLRESWALRI